MAVAGDPLKATVVGGVATFTNLRYDTAETITLTFASGNLATATSGPIVVSHTTPAGLILHQQPPTTAIAGQVFGAPPIVVEEVDQYGNVITTDSTTTVTAARGDTGTSTLLGNSLTMTLADGVASFTGLSYDKAEQMDITFTSSVLNAPV